MIAINELEDMATLERFTNSVAIAETSRAEKRLSNDAATTPQTSKTPAARSASLNDRWASSSSLIVELFVNNIFMPLFALSISICLFSQGKLVNFTSITKFTIGYSTMVSFTQ